MKTNTGYNGNPLLKKSNIKQDFTKNQIKELQKCASDIPYFVKTYCQIITLDAGRQFFDPYEYQIRMLETFDKNKYIVNLLPRQMGKTTVVAAYLLHYIIFNPESAVAILANKADVSREILTRLKRMYQYLPHFLQPGVVEWNKGSIVLDNESWVLASATSSDSIRGYSFNIVYLDEFAHIENQAEFWESTYPTISSGKSSKVIITSTPSGIDLFHKIYSDAINGKNNFTPVTVHWREHPERDDAWKEETLKNIGEEQFEQEFECAFLGSSGTLIAGWKLKELVSKIPEDHEKDSKHRFHVFEKPREGREYVLVADVAEGKGLDYCAVQVIDVTEMPYNQAAVFHSNKINPIDFAERLYRLGAYYNMASVLVENNFGRETLSTLHYDMEYEGIIWTKAAKGSEGAREVSGGFGGGSITEMGVRTTKATKKSGCSVLKMLVEQNQLIINDQHTIVELSQFVKKNNSYEADNNGHDDLVMCLVIFAWFSVQTYFAELSESSTLTNLKSEEEDEMSDLPAVGFFDNGVPDSASESEYTL